MLLNTQKILLILVWFLAAAPVLAQDIKTDIYVSLQGSDQASGHLNAPVKSLERARELIRILKKAKGLPNGGINVWIKGGDYKLKNAFKLTAEDSGETGKSVCYRAYQNENVSLSLSASIKPELWKPLNKEALKRVHPNVNPSALVALDVAAAHIKNTKRFAPVNQFLDQWYSIDLFANGKRQPIAQWPNPNENIRGLNNAGWVTANGAKDNLTFYYGAGGNPKDLDQINELDLDGSNRSLRWRQSMQSGHDIWLKGFWRVPWGPITSKVKEINLQKQYITLLEEPEGGMGSKYSPIVSNKPLWRTGNGKENWMLINSLEEIDQPGEWALDVKDQKIYFYPPAPVNTLRIEISDQNEPVVQLKNVSHVGFEQLNIAGTLGNGLEFLNGAHNKISGCTISNVGASGIYIKGGDHNSVVSNTIFDVGAAGIEMADQGDRMKLISSESEIVNNYIHHIGKLSFRESIQLRTCVGIHIAHNLLHDLPKSAIRTDMINNCLFEYNEIHNIALKESDNGAFYNYGGWSTYGNTFRFNLVHHINRSNGFYCDDGDSGDLFYNNIVLDVIDAVKFGGGHDNIARNNIFINSKSQVVDDRGISRNYKLGTGYETHLQQVAPFTEPWKSYGVKLQKDYELTHDLWSDVLRAEWHPEYPNGCVMKDNVTINGGKFIKPVHGEVTIVGNTFLKTVKEAGFYDYKNMDLRSDHPVILDKFPDLNGQFLKMGLYTDRFRKHVPSRKETGGLINRGKAGDLYNEDQFVD